MNDANIAETFRAAFLNAESPDAPVNSIRRRLAAQAQPRHRLSFKSLTVALVLSTTGLAFAAPQSRAVISATGAAFVSSVDAAMRELMNPVPTSVSQVSRDAGHQINIPKNLDGLNPGSIAKIGNTPKTYEVTYTGKSGCSIDLTLTVAKSATPGRSTFMPLPGGGMLFGSSAKGIGVMGSSSGACSDTRAFVKAFLAQQ